MPGACIRDFDILGYSSDLLARPYVEKYTPISPRACQVAINIDIFAYGRGTEALVRNSRLLFADSASTGDISPYHVSRTRWAGNTVWRFGNNPDGSVTRSAFRNMNRRREKPLQTSGMLSMDTNQESCAHTYRLLVAGHKAVVISRFKIPTKAMFAIRPEHEVSRNLT